MTEECREQGGFKPALEFAGVWFTDKEIKTITIERDGAEIVISRKEPERKMGFKS